ncbi:MAG: hypothetical protein AABZ83_09565, partial [candidate division NC10 bacterium]
MTTDHTGLKLDSCYLYLLTAPKANQGYWDRIKRARSWVGLAQELDSDDQEGVKADPQQLFVLYWVAFNSMYGRVNETDRGGYLRPIDDDA